VYCIELGLLFEREMPMYLVEFFSTKNLYIPYPAVMINHIGADFCNVVHSYNRLLNDIFEDDAINKHQNKEAAIEVVNGKNAESFVIFSSGMFDVDDVITFEYAANDQTIVNKLPIKVKRLTNKWLKFSEIFPELPQVDGGVLKISQPAQKMFYGRIIAGIARKDSNAFSANHSYYDLSQTSEYWSESELSYITHPYFADFSNIIRMYPIMPPGEIDVWIEFYMEGSNKVVCEKQVLNSPSSQVLEININELVKAKGLEGVTAYRMCAGTPKGQMPTRISYNLVLADEGKSELLPACINLSLFNDDVFIPQGKKGYSWGQCVTGSQYKSLLGIAFYAMSGEPSEVTVDFYNEQGLIRSDQHILASGKGIVIDVNDVVADSLSDEVGFVWYVARSQRYDLAAYSVHSHKTSHHASAEHSF
jgi:hypothetical protein